MPIPLLNNSGLLPPGLHDCALNEVRSRFGTFQGSENRPALFEKLAEMVAALQRSKLFEAVIIDGSFVTEKASPEDIDVIIVLRRDHDWQADVTAADYALVSRSMVHRRFGFDVFLAISGGVDYIGYVEFFSRVRTDASARKGMLRVKL